MATRLRLMALVIAVLTIALWFFGGPNWKTTQIRVPQTLPDTKSGREEIVWEYRFLPGTDFLIIGLVGAAALLGGSFGVSQRKDAS